MDELIFFNFVQDLRKKDISPFVRARIINKYLIENDLSQRAFAKQMGVPHSTVQDWLLWCRITRDNYDKMKNNLSDSEIYRILRNGKKDNVNELIKKTGIDYKLEESIKIIKRFIRNDSKYWSEGTIGLVNELKNELNRLMMRIDK